MTDRKGQPCSPDKCSEPSFNVPVNPSVLLDHSKNTSSVDKSFGLHSPQIGRSKTQYATPQKIFMTPGKARLTPGNRTPSRSGDRFIPNRRDSQLELGHFLLSNSAKKSLDMDDSTSPSRKEFQNIMNINLNNGAISESKILSFKAKATDTTEGHTSSTRLLYSVSKPQTPSQKTPRHIPQVPDRILDAPDILDDYYLNLLDWSSNNHLAVCLGAHLYLWNAGTGDIKQLLELFAPGEYISSVAWVKEGNVLAVGNSNAEVQLWDVEKQKKLRTMAGHTARVGALSWNAHVLSSGSRSGSIHHHDVRVSDHHIGTLAGHTQEVCGLKWSPDGKHLASGGNDNLLNVWQAGTGMGGSSTQPLYTFTEHTAAVKALAWCPWQRSLLASGGGTADRHIRFWNCNTGACVNSIDTKSQVCSLLWSKEHKELVSSHGYALNQLTIWKYPSLKKVTELTGHKARVLHTAMSPDGTTVVSAAADETLRLWKCFDVDSRRKKDRLSAKKNINSALMTSLR